MTMRFRFQNMTSSRGDEVPLIAAGVTCIVGANNAGKSQLLRDLVNTAQNGARSSTVVLRSAGVELLVNDAEEAGKWLERHALPSEHPTVPPSFMFLPSQNEVTKDAFFQHLTGALQGDWGLGYLDEGFVRRIPAGALSSFASGELRTDASPDSNRNWLLRQLYSNGDLERELSALVENLFSTPIFLDRQNFPPRVRAGVMDVEVPPANAITARYAKAAAGIPALDDQGDGIRSFTGLALVVLALAPEVLLLDEPESFLHPGQARAVGRWLAEAARERNIQVLASTHDKDFLIGLLSAGRNDALQVVRVDRHPDGSSFRATTSDQLNDYWGDPVLRFSNVLQGLFHERVIVCEGDVDCRFYAAAGEELAIEINRRQVTDNTLFVPSGGKNGMPKLLGVLGDLGVDASVVADFDVLDSADTLQSIVRSLGTEWDDELANAYAAAAKQIPTPADAFWRATKKSGMSVVPRGDATRDFSRLIELLRFRRLHVLTVGELEDFHRPVGKGPEWLSAALTANAHRSAEVQALLTQVIPDLAV